MTQGLNARRAAIMALGFTLKSRTALDTALAQTPDFEKMEARDRAFARLISATTLRRRGQIRGVLRKFMQRALPDPDGEAQLILETAVAQILFLDTKPHAAVSAAVTLARGNRSNERYAGMINAVLRKVSTQGQAVAETIPVSQNLPRWLRESWTAAYGEERVEAIARAFDAAPPLDLTFKTAAQAEAFAKDTDSALLPTRTVRRMTIGDITKLPGFDTGDWWAQDAGAAIPAMLLDAKPGEAVLDLCAAPGGKTMQLAATEARVTALEASPKRMKRLEDNLARVGLTAEMVTADGQDWGEAASFDAIILDAPCSATGTLRRRPDAAWMKSREDVVSLAPIQDRLLVNAARLLKPGGRMVICTCSLQPEEGELWLKRNLSRMAVGIDPVRADEMPELEAAILEDGTVRLTPDMWSDKGGIDGFFIARLRKPASA